jgi:hypothetical protein
VEQLLRKLAATLVRLLSILSRLFIMAWGHQCTATQRHRVDADEAKANLLKPAPKWATHHDSPPCVASPGYTAEEEAEYLAELDAALAVRDELPDRKDLGDGYFRFVEPLTDVQRSRALDDSEPITLWDGSEAWRSKECDDA